MSNKQKLHLDNHHQQQQLGISHHSNNQLHEELLIEINKPSCDESDLFDNIDQLPSHLITDKRMIFSSSASDNNTSSSSFITRQQQEEINQHYLNNNHQTILNPHDLNNNFDNLFSQESDQHDSISNHNHHHHHHLNNPSSHIILPTTSNIQPSLHALGLNPNTFGNGINAPLESFGSNDMLTTSTFMQANYGTPQPYPSLKVQKPESNNDFTSFRQMQYFGNLGETKENSSSYQHHSNSNSSSSLLSGGSAIYKTDTTSSSFEKREFGSSPLTFKENSHISTNNKTEMMTNDLGKDYSFISEGEDSNKQMPHHHQHDNPNLDAISFSIEDDTSATFSNPILPITTSLNNNNNLFNTIQQRATPNVIQRARSHSMQNPLRRDANQTFNIDGMVNTYMNNNNTNLPQQQHLYSPSSSSNSPSFASSPPQGNNCSPMQQQQQLASSSTEVLTNAPIMDNSYQHTSSLHPMNGSPTISMDKIIQNKVKKTYRSRSFHSRDKMELSDAMVMDNSHSYQYFGFNNANNANNNTYSPTSSAGCSSMEQSPPPSPLATFLSQIDISKLNQEQLAALQVLCMSNQNNLTSPVSNTYTSSNEVIISNQSQQQQRRSSVASYMSDDSSTTPRDSLLKTVLQKQLHTNNEVAEENQALYSMIDNALSGCKSSLGLKLVTNENPVNNFPTRSRTFSSPPQFQITPAINIPQEIVSPMSRSSEETVPTIEIPNSNTFNFGSFGSDYEQNFENGQSSGVHPRHHSSPAINTFVNRVEKPTKTKRRSSSVRGTVNNASSSTGQLEQTMVASAVSAVASSSNNSKKGGRRNSISSVEQQPIVTAKQSKSQNYNKTIVFNNYYDEIQFKKKYGPNSTFYKFK